MVHNDIPAEVSPDIHAFLLLAFILKSQCDNCVTDYVTDCVTDCMTACVATACVMDCMRACVTACVTDRVTVTTISFSSKFTHLPSRLR